MQERIEREKLTGDADKLLARDGDELLLVVAAAAALDEVELEVDLVGAVEADVEVLLALLVLGLHDHVVDGEEGQAGDADQVAGLDARGHELHAVRLRPRQVRDGLDDVLDGRAGPDADPRVRRVQVLGHGLLPRGPLGRLDEVARRADVRRGRGLHLVRRHFPVRHRGGSGGS